MPHTEAVRAVYRNGVLEPLEPIDLREGTAVWLQVKVGPKNATGTHVPQQTVAHVPAYPTRPQTAETLAKLTGLIAVGGNAVAEAEALYDADCH